MGLPARSLVPLCLSFLLAKMRRKWRWWRGRRIKKEADGEEREVFSQLSLEGFSKKPR